MSFSSPSSSPTKSAGPPAVGFGRESAVRDAQKMNPGRPYLHSPTMNRNVSMSFTNFPPWQSTHSTSIPSTPVEGNQNEDLFWRYSGSDNRTVGFPSARLFGSTNGIW
jgi:hypothetical protein